MKNRTIAGGTKTASFFLSHIGIILRSCDILKRHYSSSSRIVIVRNLVTINKLNQQRNFEQTKLMYYSIIAGNCFRTTVRMKCNNCSTLCKCSYYKDAVEITIHKEHIEFDESSH